MCSFPYLNLRLETPEPERSLLTGRFSVGAGVSADVSGDLISASSRFEREFLERRRDVRSSAVWLISSPGGLSEDSSGIIETLNRLAIVLLTSFLYSLFLASTEKAGFMSFIVSIRVIDTELIYRS